MVFRFPGKRVRARGIDASAAPARGGRLNPQTAAYQRNNPRLYWLAGLLGMLLLILAGGLAWQQVLLKPYVKYHNESLLANYTDWMSARVPVLKAGLLAKYKDGDEKRAEDEAESAAKVEYAKMFLFD